MKYLDFVLWLILFPVSQSLVGYLDYKTKEINKVEYKASTQKEKEFGFWLSMFVWVFVAYLIFQK
jgi:hypothetical protein